MGYSENEGGGGGKVGGQQRTGHKRRVRRLVARSNVAKDGVCSLETVQVFAFGDFPLLLRREVVAANCRSPGAGFTSGVSITLCLCFGVGFSLCLCFGVGFSLRFGFGVGFFLSFPSTSCTIIGKEGREGEGKGLRVREFKVPSVLCTYFGKFFFGVVVQRLDAPQAPW